MATAVRPMIYVSFLEFQAGSCLYVTAAVKGGSLRASRTWSQRPKLVQGSLEPVGALVSQLILLLSPCSSFSAPRSSLVCPWTLVRSWEHLSLSLSLSLSLALSPFLDGCVLGHLSGSWEHLRLPPLCSSLLPASPPTPFLSLPYAGVYTLLDNSVQGCLGLSVCSWQPHQPSFLQLQETGASFPFLVLPLLRLRAWITACRGAWAFYCAAGNRTNHPH